jgi:ABC-type branched-subunit amino acid transport system ATPase component/predicted MFS family arabinose efflux permease
LSGQGEIVVIEDGTEEPQNVGMRSDSKAADLASLLANPSVEGKAGIASDQDVTPIQDLLPGSTEAQMSLRDGLRKAGARTFLILAIIVTLDNLQSSGLAVLAPNIQQSYHVSTSAIVFVTGISGGFLVLGIVPMGWLADRYRRPPIIGSATMFFGLMVAATGMATNVFLFFLARLGAGVSQASTTVVHGSLLADTYPITLRGRIAAAIGVGSGTAAALSPVLVGLIATSVGGVNGWRWAFYLLAIPILVVALVAFRIKEAPRGQFEKKSVLGSVITDSPPAAPSMEAAFARIMRIRTIKAVLIAFSAIGFGLFTAPVLGNLYLKDRFHLDAFQRGLIGTIGSVGVLIALPVVGRYYDRLYREDPSRALSLIGKVILPVAILVPIQYSMPNALLWAIFSVPSAMLLLTAFSMVTPVLTSVAPYRLRGMVSAVGGLYVFFVGAFGGAILSALLESLWGVRTTVLIITIPSIVIGAFFILRSAHFIRNDLSLVVVELQEEMEEHARQEASPEDIPMLQLSGIDFSYGHVQILFGVSLEVKRGEVLALLGTNGAGKSTVLRVAAGLETATHGVVRLHGQDISYTTPEQRSRLGIHLLPGGTGVFSDMTVADNLEMGAFNYRSNKDDVRRRIARVYGLFPVLAERRKERAGSLSGGQQQMLALAITMLHDPQILMIDELSLGLAPIVVQELINVVENLKDSGVTLVIVEQSLNVAAAIADRAVFLEKGRVRFEGPTRELMERQDLARAVFLGGATE